MQAAKLDFFAIVNAITPLIAKVLRAGKAIATSTSWILTLARRRNPLPGCWKAAGITAIALRRQIALQKPNRAEMRIRFRS